MSFEQEKIITADNFGNIWKESFDDHGIPNLLSIIKEEVLDDDEIIKESVEKETKSTCLGFGIQKAMFPNDDSKNHFKSELIHEEINIKCEEEESAVSKKSDLKVKLEKEVIFDNGIKEETPETHLLQTDFQKTQSQKIIKKNWIQTDTNKRTTKPRRRNLNDSEVIYKCEYCPYKTVEKWHINRHLIGHKDPSEIKMYKCTMCDFQSKYKGCLKIHALQHKDSSEIEMYKCPHCAFQSKHKYNLKVHSMRHLTSDEEKMVKVEPYANTEAYRCAKCDFHTLSKFSLKVHIIRHRSSGEIMCPECDYNTFNRTDLKNHVILHKKDSVDNLKCPSCTRQTVDRSHLRTRIFSNDKTKDETNKCFECGLQFKIERHTSTRHAPLRTEMTCDRSDLATTGTTSLPQQGLRKRRKMHKCAECEYSTILKGNMTRHARRHAGVGEIEVYQCHECNYRTSRRDSLKYHISRHKKHELVPKAEFTS